MKPELHRGPPQLISLFERAQHLSILTIAEVLIGLKFDGPGDEVDGTVGKSELRTIAGVPAIRAVVVDHRSAEHLGPTEQLMTDGGCVLNSAGSSLPMPPIHTGQSLLAGT